MLEQQVRDWQGRVLGCYQFLQLLGRGGMGDVWLALDQRDQRQVAIKLLPSILVSEDEHLSMFKREARIAASLKHPHILPLYDFGEEAINEDEVACYLVMPYIPDGTLRERMRTTKGLLPVLEGLRYLRQAAEAIDYVHSQQVLHRDIKPANMLLKGDWLFLTDFGIARLRSSDSYHSLTYAGSGTPGYMAPEQVQRRAEAASDRYSLGITAYQIFTGSQPFTGKDPCDVLLKQIEEQPPAPHLLNPHLPSSIEGILLRALAKQPEERYPSCLAFITALEQAWQHQFTAETVIKAHKEADAAIVPPLAQASPEPVVMQEGMEADVVMASQLAQSPLNTPSLLPSEPELPTVQMAPMLLDKVPPSTGNGAINTEPETAQARQAESVNKGKHRLGRRAVLIGGAITVLLAAGGSTALPPLKRITDHPQPLPPGPRQFTPGKALMILSGHTGTVQNVTWDPTSRYLATASADTRVMFWDVGNVLHKYPTSVQTMNQPTRKWKFASGTEGNSLHWTLDGQKLIVSDTDMATFTLLDPFATQSSRQTFTNKNLDPQKTFTFYRCVVPRPHSDMLAAIAFTGPRGPVNVDLWQLNKPDAPVSRLTYTVPASQSNAEVWLTVLAWSCDGSLLAGHLTTEQLVIWNVQTRTVHSTIAIPPPKNLTKVNIFKVPLAWSPTDPYILAAFNVDAIAIVDVRQGKILYQLTTDDKDALTLPPTNVPWFPHVISLTWSPNGRYIAASYARAERICVWDLQAHTSKTDTYGRRLQQYLIPEASKTSVAISTVFDLSWSPDGRYLATSSYDFSTIIWQVDSQ